MPPTGADFHQGDLMDVESARGVVMTPGVVPANRALCVSCLASTTDQKELKELAGQLARRDSHATRGAMDMLDEGAPLRDGD